MKLKFESANDGKGVDQNTFHVERPKERNNGYFVATVHLCPTLLGKMGAGGGLKSYAGVGNTEDEAVATCTDQLIADLKALADYLRAP